MTKDKMTSIRCPETTVTLLKRLLKKNEDEKYIYETILRLATHICPASVMQKPEVFEDAVIPATGRIQPTKMAGKTIEYRVKQ